MIWCHCSRGFHTAYISFPTHCQSKQKLIKCSVSTYEIFSSQFSFNYLKHIAQYITIDKLRSEIAQSKGGALKKTVSTIFLKRFHTSNTIQHMIVSCKSKVLRMLARDTHITPKFRPLLKRERVVRSKSSALGTMSSMLLFINENNFWVTVGRLDSSDADTGRIAASCKAAYHVVKSKTPLIEFLSKFLQTENSTCQS